MTSHLTLAHQYWTALVQPGDTVIDATCGNGHDTLCLANLVLKEELNNVLYALDIQDKALESTLKLLSEHLPVSLLEKIKLIKSCHSLFPTELTPASVKLIVYNLGYLPRGNKNVTTVTETTLASISQAIKLVEPGGAISISCYPGHLEGEKEEMKILEMVSTLNPHQWSCCHHRWINRRKAPSLLIIKHLDSNTTSRDMHK